MPARRYRRPPWAKAEITDAYFRAFFGERVSASRKVIIQSHARQKILYTNHTSPAVREFAAKFKPGLAGIKALVDYVAGFQLVLVDADLARKLYAQRSADEIIASTRVPTSQTVGPWGCNDQVIALIAALRAMGFKRASFVRTILDYTHYTPDKPISIEAPHSVALVPLRSKIPPFKREIYVLDPWRERANRVVKATPELEAQIQKLKSWNLWLEAADPSRIGLTSFLHFKDILKNARVP